MLFSLTIPLGGSHDTFANAGTKIYFFLEAIVYAAVKAVLLCVCHASWTGARAESGLSQAPYARTLPEPHQDSGGLPCILAHSV